MSDIETGRKSAWYDIPPVYPAGYLPEAHDSRVILGDEALKEELENDPWQRMIGVLNQVGRFPAREVEDLAVGETTFRSLGDVIHIDLYPYSAINLGKRPRFGAVSMMGGVAIGRTYSNARELFYVGNDGEYYVPASEDSFSQLDRHSKIALNDYIQHRADALQPEIEA